MLGLVTATQIVQPNALDSFSGSLEPGVSLRARGKVWVPAGAEGELLLRRIMVEGWNTAGISLWLSVYVNGAELTTLRTYLSRPANPNNERRRFSFLVPCMVPSTAFPTVMKGVRGTALDALVEVVAPEARFDLEGVTFLIEPLGEVRARTVSE